MVRSALVGTLAYLALPVLGWRGVAAFFVDDTTGRGHSPRVLADWAGFGVDLAEQLPGELVANAGRPGTTSVSFIDTSTSWKREPPSASATVRAYLILFLRTVVDFGQPPGWNDEAQVYRGVSMMVAGQPYAISSEPGFLGRQPE